MNLLLLDGSEREGAADSAADGTPDGANDSSEQARDVFVLRGARAAHVRDVLRKAPGDDVRAGLVGQGVGQARLLGVGTDLVRLVLGPLEPEPIPSVQLIVAMPRPKGLSRLLQAAASFGVRSIDLVGGFRVDKAYFDSPRLTPERLREDLWLGLRARRPMPPPHGHRHASPRHVPAGDPARA